MKIFTKKETYNLSENSTLLKISIPRNNEKTLFSAEYLFTAIHGIITHNNEKNIPFCFEITSSIEGIVFYVMAPKEYSEFIQNQIYAQYPDSEIVKTDDYINLFLNFRYFSLKELSLDRSYIFPLNTFTESEIDPLSSVTSTLSKINQEGIITIQLLIKPVSNKWHKKGLQYISRIKSGKTFFDILKTSQNITVKKEISLEKQNEISEIERKISKVGFECSIRIAISINNQGESDNLMQNIIASFNQYTNPRINSFKVKNIEKNMYLKFSKRNFGKNKFILNTEELASLYHLPNITVETPLIAYSKTKKIEPPLSLPTENVISIGTTVFRHINKTFGIQKEDRRRHMYILGKTGSGKSTMMENMIIQDIINGDGVGVIDPHGDLAEDLLNFIPPQRINDVVLIDPSDSEYPISINLLELKNQEIKDLVADNIIEVFKKYFDSWGPRLEYILHNTILTLIQVKNTSLLGIQRMLTDRNYRNKILKQLEDPVLLKFWEEEFKDMGKNPKLVSEAIAPIQNKVGRFLSSATIRNIVGQVTSTIDLESMINSKKIIIINLSQGKIGEENVSLLGSLLITRLQSAAMQRVSINESQRPDFYLYIDEFQNFATKAFIKILSEARKYRLNLILTHQYISQVEEDVQNAIFGNIGTFISFVVGNQDSLILENEFVPSVTSEDLISLERYHFYIKLMIDNMISKPFSAISLPLQYQRNDNKAKTIKVSRERYGRSKKIIEDKIKRWYEN